MLSTAREKVMPACLKTSEKGACSVCRGQRVIYTTPLKALSNQKLYEMRQRFGSDMVGLQTGDASLNLDSSIVVMTTEVLRNIMYRTDSRGAGASPSSLPGYAMQWLSTNEVFFLVPSVKPA